MTSDLKSRVVTGVVLLVAAVALLWVGGIALWLLTLPLALGMVAEWAGLLRAPVPRAGLALAGMAAAMLLAAPLLWGADRFTVAALVSIAFLVAMITNSAGLGLGLCYAGLPIVALLFLRGLPHGFGWAIWAFAIVWATDIGAFFAGRAIGGPLLAPRLSPKKTWAGLGGGAAAAAIVGGVIAAMAGLPAACLWLGAPLAVLAQGGDLFESVLKRRAGVKDSGRLLPGHGGLLDRLDGAVPVLATVGALVAGGAL